MKRKNSTTLQEKVKDIIKNARIYHKNFYNNSPFKGPSLYFHRRAIGLGSSD